jgi:hypothetical protein
MRKHFSRIAVGLLLGALIGMTALFVREAHLVQLQRHLILEMYTYIVRFCSQSMVQ